MSNQNNLVRMAFHQDLTDLFPDSQKINYDFHFFYCPDKTSFIDLKYNYDFTVVECSSIYEVGQKQIVPPLHDEIGRPVAKGRVGFWLLKEAGEQRPNLFTSRMVNLKESRFLIDCTTTGLPLPSETDSSLLYFIRTPSVYHLTENQGSYLDSGEWRFSFSLPGYDVSLRSILFFLKSKLDESEYWLNRAEAVVDFQFFNYPGVYLIDKAVTSEKISLFGENFLSLFSNGCLNEVNFPYEFITERFIGRVELAPASVGSYGIEPLSITADKIANENEDDYVFLNEGSAFDDTNLPLTHEMKNAVSAVIFKDGAFGNNKIQDQSIFSHAKEFYEGTWYNYSNFDILSTFSLIASGSIRTRHMQDEIFSSENFVDGIIDESVLVGSFFDFITGFTPDHFSLIGKKLPIEKFDALARQELFRLVNKVELVIERLIYQEDKKPKSEIVENEGPVTSDIFIGGVLGLDKKIYFLNKEKAAIIDSEDFSLTTISNDRSFYCGKSYGCIADEFGRVLGVPADKTEVVVFNYITNEFENLQDLTDLPSFDPIGGSEERWWGAIRRPRTTLAYCLPYDSQALLTFALGQTITYNLVALPISVNPEALRKWAGGAAGFDGFYGIPCEADWPLFFTNNSAANISFAELKDESLNYLPLPSRNRLEAKWCGGVYFFDNCIYCCPAEHNASFTDPASNAILKIKSKDEGELISFPDDGTSWGQFNSMVIGGDGFLYGVPVGNVTFRFNPRDNSFQKINLISTALKGFNGGVLGEDGKIYFSPFGGANNIFFALGNKWNLKQSKNFVHSSRINKY